MNVPRFNSKVLQLVILMIIPMHSLAQNGIFLSTLGEFGGGGVPHEFAQGGTVLTNNWIGVGGKRVPYLTYDPELTVQYNFLNHFGITLGAKFYEKDILTHDQKYMNANDVKGVFYESNFGGEYADRGEFNPVRWYFSPNISASYIFGSKKGICFPFVSYGAGFNQFLSRNLHNTELFIDTATNEHLELTFDFRRTFVSQYLEAGYYFYPRVNSESRGVLNSKSVRSGAAYTVSLRYTFIGNYFNGDYSNTKNGVVQYTDHITASGSYLSLVLKTGGSIFAKPINRIYQRKYDAEQIHRAKPTITKDNLAVPKEISGRTISTTKEIMVKNSAITISVRDHLKYDKDIISLNFNGEWILQDYTLQLKEKLITAIPEEESNYLILYAISEGEEKPCTAAIIIDDGYTKQEVILNSTMKTSEAIRIKVVK